MRLFLYIVAILIVVALLLPVNIILKTEASGEFVFKINISGKTVFGEKKSKRSRKKKETPKDGSSSNKEKVSFIISILKRLMKLLSHCKVKVMKLRILCAEGDAAKTAISYGMCNAVVWPIIGAMHSKMRVCKKGEKIEILCDYSASKGSVEFEIQIMVRVARILGALALVAADKIKSMREKKNV